MWVLSHRQQNAIQPAGTRNWELWEDYQGCHRLSDGTWQEQNPIRQERRQQQIASCKPWRSIPKSGDLHSKIESIFAFRNQNACITTVLEIG